MVEENMTNANIDRFNIDLSDVIWEQSLHIMKVSDNPKIPIYYMEKELKEIKIITDQEQKISFYYQY